MITALIFAAAAATATAAAASTAPAASAAAAAAPAQDSVTSREADVMIDGQSYTHVQYGKHDYYLKATRPGSVLQEVECERPGKPANEPLEPKSRSQEFLKKLEEGCSPKDGQKPQSFTFEQRENKTAKQSQEAAKKPERPDAKLYPPELDPHVLPDPTGPGSTFDPDQKRYY